MSDKAVIKSLNRVLADSIVTYQKLHHYHWRVSGMHFFGLHNLFEKLYDEWAEIMDDVAERVLTIEGAPVATLKEALDLSSVQEDDSVPAAKEMVNRVESDLKTQLADIQSAIAEAEKAGDRGTAAMLDGFAESIEKTLWMIRATLA